jgi:DNA-binding NtrC family response regulator
MTAESLKHADVHQAAAVTSIVDEQSHLVIQKLQLKVIEGPDIDLVGSSKDDRLVIGSDPLADLRLTDPTVSRFHCEISVQNGQAEIRDLGSRNGTFVDGVGVLRARLHNWATICCGRTRLRFDVGGETVSVPLAMREKLGSMVGKSLSMQRVFAVLAKAAESDATVLIEGETGTGKELAAEALHLEGQRASGPFIVFDCSAVPVDLMESELFGHEKGAFTGAASMRDGAFQAADGGTIFLDEIGELEPALQPKLLRALEKREVKRVGGNRYTPINVRVVAATNRNLREEVNAKRFRSDLFYRLAVVQVRLPPLRERLDDLPILMDNILNSFTSPGSHCDFVRSREFLDTLSRHSWPGNVRELRNYLERCITLREHSPLADETRAETGLELDVSQPIKAAREHWISTFEKEYLRKLLEVHQDNITAAAKAAGVDRAHLYRLLWKNGLR